MPLTRRQLLMSGAALTGGLALPRLARAANLQRKFVFVVNFGGWDTTRVLSPAFDNPLVSMENRAQPGRFGDINFVDHPDRPVVRSFFDAHHSQLCILNGLLVPSVAHMACLRLLMTGQIAGRPDWPATLAAGLSEQPRALPNLVISGPSYPENLGGFVTRTGGNGQLEALLSGELLTRSDQAVVRADDRVQALEAELVLRRAERSAAAARSPQEAALTANSLAATLRAQELKEVSEGVQWNTEGDFSRQCGLAVDLLAQGLSSCVSLRYPNDWDTHSANSFLQNINWRGLFTGLTELMNQLQQAPGEAGGSLADETVVVVLSEMGRTPGMNAEQGKDHWPYTSAMLLGPGLQGGQVFGGYDAGWYGERLDPSTGAISPDGQDVSCDMLGATLLALADIDPQDHLPGAQPIQGMLL